MPRIALLSLALSCLPAAAGEPPVALWADEWCPHTCTAGAQPGHLVEATKAVLQRLQLKGQLRSDNWSRLKLELPQQRQPVLVLGLARVAENERDYVLNRVAFAHSPFCFFTRSGDPWRYRGPASLAGRRLNVTQGYAYTHEVDAYLTQRPPPLKVQAISGVNPVPRHVAMLTHGRTDAVLDDREAVRWAAKAVGGQAVVQEAGCLKSEDDGLYVGMPRHLPGAEAWMKRFDAELARLRASGQLGQIQARYGLLKSASPPAAPRP